MHRDFKKQARVKRSTFTESAKVLRFPSASAFLRPKVAARILFRFPHFPPLIHNNHQLFGPFFCLPLLSLLHLLCCCFPPHYLLLIFCFFRFFSHFFLFTSGLLCANRPYLHCSVKTEKDPLRITRSKTATNNRHATCL